MKRTVESLSNIIKIIYPSLVFFLNMQNILRSNGSKPGFNPKLEMRSQIQNVQAFEHGGIENLIICLQL